MIIYSATWECRVRGGTQKHQICLAGLTRREVEAQRHHAKLTRSHLISRKENEMKWITREKARVDRIACPWLISRFIEPKSEFLFVPAAQVLDPAKRDNAIP